MRLTLRVFPALACLFCIFIASTQARAADTTASRVFALDSPSVFIVKVNIGDTGISQGSAVAISKDVVISNCHVLAGADKDTLRVIKDGASLPATVQYAAPDHDLCALNVPGLNAPAVNARRASTLNVGEDTYAIGAPEGLELTLSSGIVSSLRKISGGMVIQTTAAISPGSSGGGLFDSDGNLIGITSYYAAKGQQLNFALSVEWIESLLNETNRYAASNDQPRTSDDETNLSRAMDYFRHDDYAQAFVLFRPLAEHGVAIAQGIVGTMYDFGHGVEEDQERAVYWYAKGAAQGDMRSSTMLGLHYGMGKGVRQDYVRAAALWRTAAEKGHASAQFLLGIAYYNGAGVQKDYSQALLWIGKAAEQGHDPAQNVLGDMYRLGQGTAQNTAMAVHWYLLAAEQGNKEAKEQLALLSK